MKISRYIIIGFAFLCVASATVLAIAHRQPVVVLAEGGSVPASFAVAAPFGNDSLVFSNGRSLISYDYRHGSYKLLTPDTILEGFDNIDSMASTTDQKYVLFHVTLANAGGTLYNQLKQEGSDLTQDYWWLYGVETGDYHHFPAGTAAVHLFGDQALAIASGPNTTLATYQLINFRPVKTVTTLKVADAFPAQEGFIATSESRLLYSQRNGSVNQILFPSFTLWNVSSDKTSVLGINHSGDSGVLVAYDLATHKQRRIGSDVSAVAAWNTQNSVIFNNTKNPGQLYRYTSASKEVVKLRLEKAVPSKAALVPDVYLDDAEFIVSSGKAAYLVGTVVNTPKQPTNNYEKVVQGSNGRPIDIKYYPEEGAFIVALDKASASSERDDVYQALKKDGYAPELLTIHFSLLNPLLPIN